MKRKIHKEKNDIIHVGDKLAISIDDSNIEHIYILAQVQKNLFILIDIDSGNRLVDPFVCKHGNRNIDIKLYGSFSLKDLKESFSSHSNFTIRIVERFCNKEVFDELANLWNEKEGLSTTLNTLLCDIKTLLLDVDTPTREQRSNIIHRIAEIDTII